MLHCVAWLPNYDDMRMETMAAPQHPKARWQQARLDRCYGKLCQLVQHSLQPPGRR